MKKGIYKMICLCGFLFVMLCSCGEKQELADISMVVGDEYVSIIWEGRTYVPFCTVSKSDCGTVIGYIDGDSVDRVCEYKDYQPEEWIANYLTVDGGAMLYKEINVIDIPDGLQPEYDWVR